LREYERTLRHYKKGNWRLNEYKIIKEELSNKELSSNKGDSFEYILFDEYCSVILKFFVIELVDDDGKYFDPMLKDLIGSDYDEIINILHSILSYNELYIALNITFRNKFQSLGYLEYCFINPLNIYTNINISTKHFFDNSTKKLVELLKGMHTRACIRKLNNNINICGSIYLRYNLRPLRTMKLVIPLLDE